MELGFKPGWSGWWVPALSVDITVLLLVSQDVRVPPETQMRVPDSIPVVFGSPLWESVVGRVLMFPRAGFVLLFTPNFRGGAWGFKNEKEGVMETPSHSYSEQLIHFALWIEVLFSAV